MARQKKSSNFNKLLHASCRVGATARKPWRIRTKCAIIKLTTGQKAEKKKKWAEKQQRYKTALLEIHGKMFEAAKELHQRFPHLSPELIATDIFQSERLQSSTKDVGKYSAFVSLECKRRNADVPEGQPRRKVHEMSKEIAAKWCEMSKEEKDAATKEELAHLHDCRANKEVGEHRVAATAAQDSFLTLERVQENLTRLTMRTGDEHLLITTRGSNKVFHKPFVFASSSCIVEFCSNAYKEVPTNMGYRMDAFMVSGVEGLARTQVQLLQQLRKDISQIILRKLRNVKVGWMYYTSFAEHITVRYGIVVTELELLWNTWETDTAHFYRMTSQEYEDWYVEYQDLIASGLHSESRGNGLEGEVSRAVEGEAPENQDVGLRSSMPGATSSPAPGPSNFVIMNVVTNANGSAVAVKKHAHKVRSDKGKPRKKKSTASENVGIVA
ncbi:hypothetical protein BT96DRAFT_1005981 [Gymnopus androsaceus JB14]|uniref:Uncharacterized protein n=1 Tax=Gymnopus androsaceus JB14 TaxID=1447944 RepID=A0A6A4GLA8_9AGAR|nr:hypothetical protein BT96DRAFT_1005981 [Gymnopus androsaceus JB14]